MEAGTDPAAPGHGEAPLRWRWVWVAAAAALGAAALVAFGMWLGRPPDDVHIPDFARRPYEPFSRKAAVAIAMREWRLFGEPFDDTAPGRLPQADFGFPERREGLWQRVGEYWWLGLGYRNPFHTATGKHDPHGVVFPPGHDGLYAWSAAFISYVMRIAGAGDRFPYSEASSHYMNEARRASLGRSPRRAVWAERPEAYAPQAGDLICFGRHENRGLLFEDLPAGHFLSHCDMVAKVVPGKLWVIGGNVDDAVSLKHVPITPEGKIATADGKPLDTRYPWCVVIKILYDR
jgi:Uncharacterized protein conserved in bacteria (DUF2272)